jgi:hypothetical protein
MAPAAVSLVLVEGENADGVSIEQEEFDIAGAGGSAPAGAAPDQVIAAIIGTREGALEGGHQLTSTGVTWTDPAEVTALRDQLAVRDVGGVMLVSPLLAAAAFAQTVGCSLGYEHIAMLFVEPNNAILAVVDGAIVDLHRQALENVGRRTSHGAIAAQLARMVAGLDARGSRADGIFLIGCGTDIVPIKPALEAATSLDVSAPEEPDMALARGAALASANAPLFVSSTAALAYALDPGTGELGPWAFSPSYLDVSANAGESALAYSALADETAATESSPMRRGPLLLAGSLLAALGAIGVGVAVVSLLSDQATSIPRQHPGASVATPAQVPAQVPPQASAKPPEAQLPAPSAPLPTLPPAVAAPPPAVEQPPPPKVKTAPAVPVYRAPAPRAPEAAPAPVQRAPAPVAPPPPVAVPAPPRESPEAPSRPPLTMYLHLPFVTIPIPINPPPPPAPPPGS